MVVHEDQSVGHTRHVDPASISSANGLAGGEPNVGRHKVQYVEAGKKPICGVLGSNVTHRISQK